MFQRLKDYIRERRIARLGREMIAAGNTQKAFALMLDMYDEIDKRSPEQIARMERKLGILPKH